MEVLMEASVLPLLFDAAVHAPGGEERERALRWQRGWPRPVVEAGRHVAGGVEQRDEGIEYAARLVQHGLLLSPLFFERFVQPLHLLFGGSSELGDVGREQRDDRRVVIHPRNVARRESRCSFVFR